MSFTLENVVPWGRSFDEYVAMFALSDDDLNKGILGCGDGPASFNASLTKRDGSIVSVDPIYTFATEEIRCRIKETYDEIMDQTRKNAHEFVWQHIPSIEELGHIRMTAMEEFLSDYQTGLVENRYIRASLPELPFGDQAFDLALCSHLLFLYSKQLSLDFHIRSIRELCRVACEARIFPLLELGTRKSRYLDVTVAKLREAGYVVSIDRVPYEFQRGGNEMMRVWEQARRV